ncbi:MAG TPA: SPW repeat protein [Stellaceae bacterium]|nr:SPW repeat protein [Stellaceae bacterium]
MAAQYPTGYYNYYRRNRPYDFINLLLAIWLFISPWVLQFGSSAGGGTVPAAVISRASWNAWVMGVLVFLVALWAISRMDSWKEGLNELFGAWIFASPWALGYTHLSAAAWDQWITGALIFLIALWSLSSARPTAVGPGLPPDERL